MANIIIIPYWIASKLNPTFELARRLEAAGHKVTFFGKSRFHQTVTDQGFAFAKYDTGQSKHATDAKGPQTFAAKLLDWVSKLFMVRQRRQLSANAQGLDSLTTSISDLSPDLVVIDIELHNYIIAAYPLRVPIVLLSTFICIWKRPGIPPPHKKITPGIGLKGHAIGIEWAWIRYRLWKWLSMQRQRFALAGADRVSVLRHFARQVGFPFDQEVALYQWLIPFSYRNLPVLSFNASELDFPNRPHPTFHLVGPLISTSRREVHASANPALDSEVSSILTRRQQGKSKALVLCAFGAFFTGDDTSFWQRLARGLADYEQWDVVFGLGGRLDVAALGQLPPNVHAFSWVPQLRILEHADCAVIHGGITTINECIYLGVPMVVCPMMATDQYGSALRAAYHGLAILIDQYQENVTSIPDSINTLLTDSSYKTRVLGMRDTFLAYSNENRAVNYIAGLLEKKNS